MRVDAGGRPCRQLDRVHHDREDHGAASAAGRFSACDAPDARSTPGLADAGMERRSTAEGEEVLHVEHANRDGDEAEHDLDGARVADEQEDVQPGGHEREVRDAAHRHEGPRDQQHPQAAVEVHEQREHEEQHPHGAGVEAVDEAERDREKSPSS
jgi:hypothetical protein